VEVFDSASTRESIGGAGRTCFYPVRKFTFVANTINDSRSRHVLNVDVICNTKFAGMFIINIGTCISD
jgi:hypothetical protein